MTKLHHENRTEPFFITVCVFHAMADTIPC